MTSNFAAIAKKTWTGRQPQSPGRHFDRRPHMDLDVLLRRFGAEYLDTHSITPKRRREQLVVLRRFAAGLDHPLDELTAQDIHVFIGDELQRRGLHPNTARKHLGMLRSFITWGSEAGLIDPTRTFQLKSVGNPRGSSTRTEPKPYKVSEIRTFYAVLAAKYPALPESGPGSRALRNYLHGRSPRLYRHLWRHARRLQFEAQIALALEEGLRLSEIANLTIPALHPDNDEVMVLTSKQGPGKQVTRAIPYAAHARAVMKEWLDFRLLLAPDHDEPWLALSRTGPLEGQLAPQTFGALAASLRKAFGHHWEWHRFRHTAATEWLRSKVPLEKVRIFMGHSSIEVTLMYTKIVNSDVAEAFGEAEADFARRLGLAA